MVQPGGWLVAFLAVFSSAQAAEVGVAVASNFMAPMQKIAQAFEHGYRALTADLQKVTAAAEKEREIDHNDQRIDRRPTLLSRVFHHDPAMLQRRQKILEAYEAFLATLGRVPTLDDGQPDLIG